MVGKEGSERASKHGSQVRQIDPKRQTKVQPQKNHFVTF